MGTTLTGTTPQDTYDSLIKVTDNGPLSGTAKYLSDGLGNDSVLALSTSKVGIATNTPAVELHVETSATGTTALSNVITTLRSKAAGRDINIQFSDGTNQSYIGSLSGALYIATGGATERVRIDATGNVGIGTSSPARLLTLKNNAGATNGISFQSLATTSEIAAIECNQTLDTIDFEMLSNFAGNGFRFLTGTPTLVERARFTANGLTFNGDTAAANALDDYEEGTFTPTIIGSTTAGTATYGGGQVGTYTKIGNVVYFQLYLGYSGGTGTGDLRIAGLPFTIPSNDLPSFTFGAFLNVALTALNIPLASGIASTNQITIEQIPTGGGSQTAVPYDASAVIQISGFYRV